MLIFTSLHHLSLPVPCIIIKFALVVSNVLMDLSGDPAVVARTTTETRSRHVRVSRVILAIRVSWSVQVVSINRDNQVFQTVAVVTVIFFTIKIQKQINFILVAHV
jgi:hypothetical protein